MSKLYQQVFGKKVKEEVLEIPLFYQGQYRGEVKANVLLDRLNHIETRDLLYILKQLVKEEILNQVQAIDNIKADQLKNLGVKIVYLADELKLILTIDPKIKRIEDWSLDIGAPSWSKSSKYPNRHSFHMNYLIQSEIVSKSTSESQTRLNLYPAYSFKDYTLESEHYYESSDSKLKRANTRLLWHSSKRQQRAELGDINFETVEKQSYRNLFGISWTKDFALNPYIKTTPTYKHKFYLEERSQVKIYVNSRLVKVAYFQAGEHTLTGVPLESGLNNILVVAKDDSGIEKTFQFSKFSSTDLIEKGVNRFSYAIGIKSDQESEDKKYITEDGPTFSLFYERGMTKELTSKFYSQGDKFQGILGTNQTYATKWGLLSLGLAASKTFDTSRNGAYGIFRYEVNLSQIDLLKNLFFFTSLDYTSKDFTTLGNINQRNNLSSTFTTSVNTSIFSNSSIGATLQFSKARYDELNDRYGFTGSLSTRISRRINANIYASKQKDEFSNWNETLYAFVTINFSEKNQYLTTYYDSTSQTKRATWSKTTSKQVNSLSSNVSVTKQNEMTTGEGALKYHSPLANISLSHRYDKNEMGQDSKKTTAKLEGSILAVGGKVRLGQPVRGSFAIINPNKYLKGQKIGVRTTSGYNEGENSLTDDIVLTNLAPFHYKLLSFDTSQLEEGYNIGKENLAIYPKYKTGHYLKIGAPGSVVLKGMMSLKGQSLTLKTGSITNIKTEEVHLFFIGRRGEFLVEGMTAGDYEIQLNNIKHKKFRFKITAQEQGLKDIGLVNIE